MGVVQGNSAGKINASRSMQREMSEGSNSKQRSEHKSSGEGHFNLGLCYEHGCVLGMSFWGPQLLPFILGTIRELDVFASVHDILN